MPVRLGRYGDLPTITSILAAGFHDEEVIGGLLRPYRDQYPQDYVAGWRRRCRERYWDLSRVFLVSFETEQASGKEVITGAAEWRRAGLGWEKVWGLWGWWDPRRLIRPLVVFFNALANFVFPDRTIARPPQLTPSRFNAAIKSYVSHYYSYPESRRNAWSLVCLAVHPEYQNRGHGRELATWGVERAREERVMANVMAAAGKERFYQRCGFTDLVGWATDGEGNPLKEHGVRGGAILFTPPVDIPDNSQ